MKEPDDPRHQARRLALQTLFEWSFLSADTKQILAYTQKQFHQGGSFDAELCEKITAGTAANREKIDKIIERAATEWPVNQIPKIDLTILRLSIFELLSKTETPPKVVIDEAVELAKEFGAENSPKFVNGVLGTVLRQMEMKKDQSSKIKNQNQVQNSKHSKI